VDCATSTPHEHPNKWATLLVSSGAPAELRLFLFGVFHGIGSSSSSVGKKLGSAF